jgi:hypothetical protein
MTCTGQTSSPRRGKFLAAKISVAKPINGQKILFSYRVSITPGTLDADSVKKSASGATIIAKMHPRFGIENKEAAQPG